MTVYLLPLALIEGCKAPQRLADIEMDILCLHASASPEGGRGHGFGSQTDCGLCAESNTAWHDQILPIKRELAPAVCRR